MQGTEEKPGSIPGLGGASGEGNDNPLQYSCLENSTDRRAWQATSLWGRKELDTTERLTLSLFHKGYYQLLQSLLSFMLDRLCLHPNLGKGF